MATWATLPPPQFDHPYSGPVIELAMTSAQVVSLCNQGDSIIACAIVPAVPGEACYIVLRKLGPGGVTPATQALDRRHELAHCNGARHNSEWPR